MADLAALECTTHKLGGKPRSRSARVGRRRRRARSGGFLLAITPDGFVTDAFEFMGAESCAQRHLFLARLKTFYPGLHVVCHDDACHLRRFAARWAQRGHLASTLADPQMKYILDRFHASGHKDPWCLAHVHPGTEENAALLLDANTSACEICFSWWSRYKHMFRTMGRWTGNFFAQEVIDLRNEDNFGELGSTRPPPCNSSASSSSSSSSSSSKDDRGTE